MNLLSFLPELKGAARFFVYEGEIRKQVKEVSVLPEAAGNPYWVRKGRIYRPAGRLILDTGWQKNLITTVGKNQLILDRLFNLSAAGPVNSVGIGATATAAAAGDTQLGSSPTIQANDATFPSRASNVVTSQSTFGTGVANVNWQECGLFNGTVNGTSLMLDHIAPIGPFTKTSAVSIVLQITITQN